MAARPKKPKVTGLKLTGLTVPLFPDTEAEIREYGVELARYMNFELSEEQVERIADGTKKGVKIEIRGGKWLPYSKGAAAMLSRWASKLPEPPLRMLKDIAQHTEVIQLQRASIATPIRGGRIDLSLRLELDIPTPESGIAYLLATILSAGYGKSLKQCELDGCNVWFFDVAEGRPTKKYCCGAHSTAQRQRTWRESQKTKQRSRRK